MDGNKRWFTSIGVWGAVATLVCPIVGAAFHVTITDEQTSTIAAYLSLIADMVAGSVALYGRISATKQITS